MGTEADPFDPGNFQILAGTIPPARPSFRPPRHKPGERFLKGPIPWAWVEAAAALPGPALIVGLRVWFEAGIRRSKTVPVNLSCGPIPRRSAVRGLHALASAGLVSVERRPGKLSLITLLPGRGEPTQN